MPLPVRRVLVGLLLALLPALAASAARPAASAERLPSSTGGTTTISVPSAPAWSASVPVAEGATLTLTATGEINYCSGAARCQADPDGSFVGEAICGTPPICGALIGRFNQGTPFLVGKSFEFDATASGTLELGVNDLPGYYGDNSGAFTVTIESEEQPPLVEEEDDTKPPVVKAFPASGRPGKTVRLRFEIDDLYDIADCEVTVFHGPRVVGQKGCDHPRGGPRLKWVTWSVPKSIHAPAVLRFCVTAWDSAGNEGKRCAKIRLRRAA